METNQVILLSVLFIFFIYYGEEYVPISLKKNKDILVGIIGGLVLCVFLKSRVEGVCFNGPGDLKKINDVESACDPDGDFESVPDSCPSKECAETLISWFNECDEGEPLFQGGNSLSYTGLQDLTDRCDELLIGDLEEQCPQGISMDSSIACGCALKQYINNFNNNRNVDTDFWTSPDIGQILRNLLNDDALISEDSNKTAEYVGRIYSRPDLICRSPKRPDSPTPSQETDPALLTRSCIDRYPAAVDYPFNRESGDNEEPRRSGPDCSAIANRDDITNINGECTVGELMTLDQYMNCSCSGSTNNDNPDGLRLKGGARLAGRYNYQGNPEACSGPRAGLAEDCPYTVENYPYDYDSERGTGIHDYLKGWDLNQRVTSTGTNLPNSNYGTGIYSCRGGYDDSLSARQRNTEDFISISHEIEQSVREICEIDVEYKIDKPPRGGYPVEIDTETGEPVVTNFMPFGAPYDTTMDDNVGNPGWIPCICPIGTKNRPPVITLNDDGSVIVQEDPKGGTVVEKMSTPNYRGDSSQYEIKSVKCTECTPEEKRNDNC